MDATKVAPGSREVALCGTLRFISEPQRENINYFLVNPFFKRLGVMLSFFSGIPMAACRIAF